MTKRHVICTAGNHPLVTRGTVYAVQDSHYGTFGIVLADGVHNLPHCLFAPVRKGRAAIKAMRKNVVGHASNRTVDKRIQHRYLNSAFDNTQYAIACRPGYKRRDAISSAYVDLDAAKAYRS